ncbi:YceI family protein [Ruegeria sp. Ofav3-42]|uniref:YceI family protein n=1 Tax=Ruegeria sp. Ofav3-42 TaxID=2917759 RepID=UPI001EF4C5B6|nr:YceI family protein [Ruegeria sp. Ofav3-42]MCG7518194.1 YceI family protein [Ruegeria sp. Ofav3-42]
MKPLHATALAIALATPAVAETYHFDQGHTEIRFYYNHAGLTEQSGEWTAVAGTVEFDPENVTATSADITIDASSVETGWGPLNDHLKSSDFFDIETFPEIRFVSTSAVQTGSSTLRMIGDLTIKDQTKPAALEIDLTFMGAHPLASFFDYYKGEWVGVEASSQLLRSDYGVGMFAPGTSDMVDLKISAEMRAGGWE